MSVGFRFEPASNGIPSSVFFPQSDPDERLTQCSASLQALLGLTSTSIQALSKLTSNSDVADDIIGVIQSALSQFSIKNSDNESIEISLNVRYVLKASSYKETHLRCFFFADCGGLQDVTNYWPLSVSTYVTLDKIR